MHACQRIGAALALSVGLAGLGLAGSASAQVPESQDPIKLTLNDWTGQLISTELMGRVLESMGYNVEYVQADYLAQFAGLEFGRSRCRDGDVGDHGQGCDGGFARHRQDGRSG